MIDRAAIRQHGIVWSGPRPGRHHDVIDAMAAAGLSTPIEGEQGFITDEGEFVGRQEAAEIAIQAGQIDKLNWPPNLFSEDLW